VYINQNHRLTLVLNGGLGNQLFQIAAGLMHSNGHPVEMNCSLGNPRRSTNSSIAFTEFDIPGLDYSLIEGISDFSRVLCNLMLKLGARFNDSQFAKIKFLVLFIFFKFFLILSGKGLQKVNIGRGLGFTPFKVAAKKTFLLGYFQTFKYVNSEQVKKSLMGMSLLNPGPDFERLREEILRDRPIVVHIRLGDYMMEEDFGMLPKDFFIDGVKSQQNFNRQKKVWVFSDDIDRARSYFPEGSHSSIKWVSDVDSSPASTLELMRYGESYVISNSSFSWWAAYLSYTLGAKVIAPSPWFQRIDEPIDLLPSDWIRVNPWHA